MKEKREIYITQLNRQESRIFKWNKYNYEKHFEGWIYFQV